MHASTCRSARATLRRVVRRAGTAVVALAVASAAAVAHADPPSYDVDYHAGPGCPDLNGLVARVAARVQSAGYAPGEAEVRFDLRIRGGGTEWYGQLQLPNDGRAREVKGASCASVVDATALIIAVALEPAAVLDLPAADAPETLKASPRPSSRVEGALPSEAVAREPSALRLLGAGGIVSSGITPSALYGLRVFGELAPRGRMGSAFRVGFSHQSSGVTEVGSGAARFALTTASLDACPGMVDAAGLLLTGCALLEAGALRAEGVARGGVSEPNRVTRPWLELGVATRFSWVIAEVVRLELSGAVTHPLTRRTYVFDNPREVVHEPALLVGKAGVGLAGELR
ncbi:MAG: hypothetical protein IPM35_15540 [Myxococcales bacterium]|nr:hypothetical protein [Myxococcales bacterium]